MCLSPIHKWCAGRIAGERSKNVDLYFGVQEEEDSMRSFLSYFGKWCSMSVNVGSYSRFSPSCHFYYSPFGKTANPVEHWVNPLKMSC